MCYRYQPGTPRTSHLNYLQPSSPRWQIDDLWHNWLIAVASSCGRAVAVLLAVCGVRLGWLRSEEAKAKHSTAKQNKARAVDLSGRRDCREHVCIRTRTSDQWVREHACLGSLRSLMSSSTSHKSQAFRHASRRDAVKTRWQMR